MFFLPFPYRSIVNSWFVQAAGLTPSTNFLGVDFGRLQAQRIVYGNNFTKNVNNATWDMNSAVFQTPALRSTCLDVINFALPTLPNDQIGGLAQLRQQLIDCHVLAGDVHIRIENAPLAHGLNRHNCGIALDDALHRLRTHPNTPNRVDIILVFLPQTGPSFYSEVKRWGDCVVGIPTVCVVRNNWNKLTHQNWGFRQNLW